MKGKNIKMGDQIFKIVIFINLVLRKTGKESVIGEILINIIIYL